MIEAVNIEPIGTRVMTMEVGRDHVLDFSHVLNVFFPTICFILWYNFLLNVANYSFFFFSFASTFGNHSRPDPRCGKMGGGG